MQERGMTASESTVRSAADLRAEFDAQFAAAPSPHAAQTESLLVVQVGHGWRAALRVAELGGIYECPPILQLPGGPPGQVGIVGLRGKLTVVFSLAAALGRERAAAPGRWLALWSGDLSVGFVIPAVEGYVRIERERIRRRGAGDGGTVSVEELAEVDGGTYPVVNLAALIAKLRAQRATRSTISQ
jgi:purine-binding chemotaxis protein CheW